MAELLRRLRAGEVILGDGSYTMTLEKRGYVLCNAWTPEASVEHPEAVKQLAIEFARAGGDITQTYSFFSDDKRLQEWHGDDVPKCNEINEAACKNAKSIAKSKNTLVAGGISMTDIYQATRNKAQTVEELKTATKVLIDNDVDFIICEYFRNVEEMEWAIEHVKTYGKPVAATMCIGSNGDEDGVSLAECGVRMAKAGADLIGLNCLFDPFVTLENMKVIKEALVKENLDTFLMCQPLGYKVPDAGDFGWINIPEFPYAIEPRQITRIEAAQYARKAYDLGVRYIGGCCGFEPYHLRAMAEELIVERGKIPEASKKSEFTRNMFMAAKRCEARPDRYANKDSKDFWFNLVPCTGRPLSGSMNKQSDPQCVKASVLQ